MTQLDTVLNVSRMTCPSCVRHVTSALRAVPGVSRIDVQLKAGAVYIRHEGDASISMMVEALREAGYDAVVRGTGGSAESHDASVCICAISPCK